MYIIDNILQTIKPRIMENIIMHKTILVSDMISFFYKKGGPTAHATNEYLIPFVTAVTL